MSKPFFSITFRASSLKAGAFLTISIMYLHFSSAEIFLSSPTISNASLNKLHVNDHICICMYLL